jgi:hypothetical protein
MLAARLARLHAAVDRQSGEAVLIVPFVAGDYVAGGQDPKRPLIETVAYVTDVPESVRVMGKVTNTGHNAELRTATHTVAFTSSSIPFELIRGDRVVLLERKCQELTAITPQPFGTDRTILKMEKIANSGPDA